MLSYLSGVLSYQIATALLERKLVIALETFEPAQQPVSLIYSGSGLLPLKRKAFLGFCDASTESRVRQKL